MTNQNLLYDESIFMYPEKEMPNFSPTADDLQLLAAINNAIRVGSLNSEQATTMDALYTKSTFPKNYLRLILVLYAPENNRILITRASRKSPPPLFIDSRELVIKSSLQNHG